MKLQNVWGKASKKAKQTAKDTFESGGLGSDFEIRIKLKVEKGINILDFIANVNLNL